MTTSRIITKRTDPDANACYYTLSRDRIHRTLDLTGTVLIDISAEGDLIGIEVLSLTAPIPYDHPALATRLTADDITQLRALTNQ